MDGEPIEEYPYLSAIGDFIPTDKCIYIFTTKVNRLIM